MHRAVVCGFHLLVLVLVLLPAPAARAEEEAAARAQQVTKLRLLAREMLDRIDADPDADALRSLLRLRGELDRLRDRALVAIFHPVAPELRASAHPTAVLLQQIVERRVRAVRAVYEDPTNVMLPQTSGVREALRYLERLFADLERLGDPAPLLRAHAGVLPQLWYRRDITVRDVHETQAEAEEQDFDRWVDGFYNEARKADCTPAAHEQVRLLNAYRRLMAYTARVEARAPVHAGMQEPALLKALDEAVLADRRPIRALRIDKRLVAAAEGHAQAMAAGGFLSHVTPPAHAEPGRRSPADRIAHAGYEAVGMAENLAAGARTAAAAHGMWLLHRAKHQILLGPWSDVGVGHVEDRWVLVLAHGDGGPQTKQPDTKPRRGSR